MKIGGFKFGKSKEKENLEEEAGTEAVDELIQEVTEDETPSGPHTPIQELSLDNGGGEVTADAFSTSPEDGAIAQEEGEEIKLVEVQAFPDAEPAPPPPAPSPVAKKETGPKNGGEVDLATSISNIFTNVEEEENPLANLIKVLPDVAATELIDDLKEINDIIKDWQKK